MLCICSVPTTCISRVWIYPDILLIFHACSSAGGVGFHQNRNTSWSDSITIHAFKGMWHTDKSSKCVTAEVKARAFRACLYQPE